MEVHRNMSSDQHTARARELLVDAQSEPDGEKSLALMLAASLHTKYAENLDI
jgi:hypothetical protein